MRDHSIFAGHKELSDGNELFVFVPAGESWHVYRRIENGNVHCGVLLKKNRETNKALFARALELI